jgi:peroxiredoxin
MPLKVGDQAPDFELESTTGQTVKLSDFKGKKNVLLCFYPLDFTPVCTSQNCSFSQDFSSFSQYNTDVLPISVDSKFCHQAFREKYNMAHHLLSDIHRDAVKKFDILFEPLNCSKRAYFLVGKDGLVKWKHVEEELKDSRTVGELLSIVKTAAV